MLVKPAGNVTDVATEHPRNALSARLLTSDDTEMLAEQQQLEHAVSVVPT